MELSHSLVAYTWARMVGDQGLTALARRLRQGRNLERVSGRIRSAGWSGIGISRLIPGLRIYTTLVAGAARVPRSTFIRAIVPATVVWVGVYVALGVLVGVPVERFLNQAFYVIVARGAAARPWGKSFCRPAMSAVSAYRSGRGRLCRRSVPCCLALVRNSPRPQICSTRLVTANGSRSWPSFLISPAHCANLRRGRGFPHLKSGINWMAFTPRRFWSSRVLISTRCTTSGPTCVLP